MRTTHHYFVAQSHKLRNTIFELQGTWTTFYDRYVIYTIRSLQFSEFEQLIDDHIGISITLEIDHHTGTFFIIRFVVYVCYSFDHFFIHQLTNTIRKGIPVHLIRHFGDHDLFTTTGFGIDIPFTENHYPATSEMHGRFH